MRDWAWTLREAVDCIKTRYEHIGRKTGAPFLAVVYPPEAEAAVLKEWRTLAATLEPEFALTSVDMLEITMAVLAEFGGENIVTALSDPMPGSDPLTELGYMWTRAVVDDVQRHSLSKPDGGKPVIVLERLAALHPVIGPRTVMQALWDTDQIELEGPVVILIPGHLVEARVYAFLGQQQEFMYRGDIL